MEEIDQFLRSHFGAIRTTAETLDLMGDQRGAYVVALRLTAPLLVMMKNKPAGELDSGWYLYCGNANGQGGIRSRLQRHLSKGKSLHWHIDQLTNAAAEVNAFAVEGGSECALIEALVTKLECHHPLRGFGASDCPTCQSHLLAPHPPVSPR